jgi:cysteine desulfurase
VVRARGDVAALIGARAEEIVFTGSATEANNLALVGVTRALPDKRHLVISAVEHPAVMKPALYLRNAGWEVTVVPVDATGRVAAEDVRKALRKDTVLVSVMHANNEVGTLQPVAEIARLAKAQGILIHTDAAQSAGKVALDVEALGVDLLTLAGHKFYAPKGVGALYIRHGTPIAPILHGAGQEGGLRPGTENVAFIVGLGAAARLARERQSYSSGRLRSLRDRLHQALLASLPGLQLNGHPEQRLPNTLHVSFPNVSGKDLLDKVAGEVAASVGSACHAHGDQGGGVLAAMGLDSGRTRGAVRLSVGVWTTEEEIDEAASALAKGWARLINEGA